MTRRSIFRKAVAAPLLSLVKPAGEQIWALNPEWENASHDVEFITCTLTAMTVHADGTCTVEKPLDFQIRKDHWESSSCGFTGHLDMKA